MRKKVTKNLDQSEINAQEKARTTAKAGRKSYSKKSAKASSQRRRRNERANAGKKQREGIRRQAFKLSDHLSDEIIEKLRVIKEVDENGTDKQDGN